MVLSDLRSEFECEAASCNAVQECVRLCAAHRGLVSCGEPCCVAVAEDAVFVAAKLAPSVGEDPCALVMMRVEQKGEGFCVAETCDCSPCMVGMRKVFAC